MAENRDTDVHLKPFLVKSLDKFMMDLSDEERYSIWDGFISKWLVKFQDDQEAKNKKFNDTVLTAGFEKQNKEPFNVVSYKIEIKKPDLKDSKSQERTENMVSNDLNKS